MSGDGQRLAAAGSPSVTADLSPAGPTAEPVRIGPNAITRMAEAMSGLHGAEVCQRVFDAAGLSFYLASPPESMLDEAHVIALHQAARTHFTVDAYAEVARLAGELTGRYVLRKRIPGPVKTLLTLLPFVLSAPILAGAMQRHAWTFAGSGAFSYRRQGRGLMLRIDDSPIARDVHGVKSACAYYTGSFERLFDHVAPGRVRVEEVACSADGDEACLFEVRRV
jgi:divinyl protochlorophyllide a 8-vinyl-reductase